MTQSGHGPPLDRRIDEPALGGPAATMAIAKACVDSHDRHTWQGAGCRTYVADERSPTHESSEQIMSAGVFAVLGTVHLVYTFGERPRYFRPADHSLLPSMRKTTTAIGPTGRDYWSGLDSI